MLDADLILTNGIVVTMNAKYDVFNPGAIAIKAGQIVWLGSMEDLRLKTEDLRLKTEDTVTSHQSPITNRPSPITNH